MDQLPEPEIFTPERIAEFLLNNSLNAQEYNWAVQEAMRLGVDPLRMDHLFRDEEWQNPSLYVSVDKVQRSS